MGSDTTTATLSRPHKDETPNQRQLVRGSRRPANTDPTPTCADPLKGLLAEGSTPTTQDPEGPSTAMGISLTPLASLCLGVVRGWINVARKGRGGQIDQEGTAWTRLPADQLRDQLAREFLVEVSTRSVQRALKELEDGNQIRREQRWKHRYKRDYWYAVTEQEEALEAYRPRTIAGNYQSSRSRQNSKDETTGAAVQVLSTPLSKTHFSKTKTKNQQPERKKTHMDAVRTCNAYGTNPPLPKREDQEQTTPSGSEGTRHGGQKRPKSNPPKGFGATTQAQDNGFRVMRPTNNQETTYDTKGRRIQQIWIGGRCYEVADDPRTAPLK